MCAISSHIIIFHQRMRWTFEVSPALGIRQARPFRSHIRYPSAWTNLQTLQSDRERPFRSHRLGTQQSLRHLQHLRTKIISDVVLSELQTLQSDLEREILEDDFGSDAERAANGRRLCSPDGCFFATFYWDFQLILQAILRISGQIPLISQ